ncbi:hypothetical protein K1719_004086 [Acacia pycnantha]|nr:hypothetical protein K1719_004086 [Acacia pycnantha]
MDIKVNILRCGENPYSSVLDLRGLPRTNEEHIHICRYRYNSKLFYILQDGDTICVTLRDPPVDKGLELKKCGVHLIFDGDDDYGGDEESVDRSLQSVSKKLAKFLEGGEWIPREANGVADWEARTSLQGSCLSDWVFQPPHQLQLILNGDMESVAESSGVV